MTNWCQTTRPGASMAPTPTAVPMVSHHSSLVFGIVVRLPSLHESGHEHERDDREETAPVIQKVMLMVWSM